MSAIKQLLNRNKSKSPRRLATVVTCDRCNRQSDLDTAMQKRPAGRKATELGWVCTHCKEWHHLYYETGRMKAKQAKLQDAAQRARQARGTQAFDDLWEAYREAQGRYQTFYDAEQARLRRKYIDILPTAKAGGF